jgi:ABC-type nitrate/sulfonate/bicarbonate transport system substrate-binding protein
MKRIVLWLMLALLAAPVPAAFALDKINVTLPSKSFQFILFPLAQERGYMREEGIELNIIMMATAAGLQAVVAGEMDFTGSGSSALVAVAQSNAPLKTVLAVNDQVLQWLMVRPEYKSFKDLKGKKIAVTGVAAVATYMLKKIAPRYGIDASKDVTFLALPPGQRLAGLQARHGHEGRSVSREGSKEFLGHDRYQR